MVGIKMYGKIQELKQLGYKKQQAARELDIDTKTVRKYWDMSEEKYAEYYMESLARGSGMERYRAYILNLLQEHSEITSAIINDRLKEEFKDFSMSYRSVRRYVCLLRESEGLPAPRNIRQYMEVQDLPMGFQAQVDLGQKMMKNAFGKKVKVYVFAMVLSASRYKYVCFQLDPFTARSFCEAHDRAFAYFGGRPAEIVYDQDRVMVVSENAGDIIYTQEFESYRSYAGFSVRLCRGSDPESKGKIESVVKYVKGNFLTCRIFHGIASLNSEGLGWLDRTGNGMIHETTKMVPKVVFNQEQKHLKATPCLGQDPVIPKIAIIRKNNVVMYRQNRYQMPKGSYYPGRKARIEVDEAAGKVRFFDNESHEMLEELPLAKGIGQCIRNTHPHRDRRTQHKDLIDKALEGFGLDEQAGLFVNQILSLKPRYTRDQMSMIVRLQEQYGENELKAAVAYCMERELFTATDFRDTLEYLATKEEEPTYSSEKLPLKYRVVTVENRSFEIYSSLMNGGGMR